MPNKGYRKYTPEELQTLSSLYEEMPLREVAKRMGKTYASVYGQKYQLGLTKSFAQINKLHYLNLEPTLLAYVAGLIDGEGTVSIRRLRGKWKPNIRIAGTSWMLMEWLSSKITGPSTFIEHRTNSKQNRAPSYMFRIEGLSHLPLYEALEPYMVLKKRHMQLVIEYTLLRLQQGKNDPFTPRQEEIVSEVRALNIKPSVQFRDAQ